MTNHSTKDDPAEDPAFSQPGYLYHRQTPPPRHRKTPATETIDIRKPVSQKHAAKEMLIKNIKTFFLVLGIMIAILVLSYFISLKAWKAKENRLMHTSSSTPALPAKQIHRGMFDSRLPKEPKFADTNDFTFSANLLDQYHRAFHLWAHMSNPWTEAGRSLMRVNDYRHAQHALELALASEPNSAALLNDLGFVYFQQKKTNKALTLFRMAADTDPTYSATYFNMALCYLAGADTLRAENYLDLYLDLEPDDPRGLREKASLEAADKQYKEALDLLKRAIRKAPKWPALYFDAAVMSAALNEPDAAIGYLEKTLPLVPIPVIYRLYQEPVFKNVRLAPVSKAFEAKLAARARELLTSAQPEPSSAMPINPPISSFSPRTP